MKKRILLFLVMAVLLLGGVSAYSFEDSLGRTVTVENPKKVACLLSSFADLWNLSGGTVTVTVGESIERGYVAGDTLLVDANSGMSINSELLLAAKPDFVILSATLSNHLNLESLLAKVGIPAAYFTLDSFSDYLKILEICSTINGRPDCYETYGLKQQKEIALWIQKAKNEKHREKILFIRAGSGLSSTKARSSDSHFAAAIIQDLGGINIADNTPLKDNLSLEAILASQPDKIFLITQGDPEASSRYVLDLFQTAGWRNLSAVKKGNYLFLDRELFHFKPNVRWSEAYRTMYELLYGGKR